MAHPYAIDATASRVADDAAALAREVAAKHAADVDGRARFPEESVRALADAGFFGLAVATGLGGKGHGPRTYAAVAEELATACASTAMIWVMHVTATQAVASSSTLAARDDVLREIAAGRHLTTLAFSERGSRSQFWAPVSRLEVRGGQFVTSAQKSFVTAARRADSYVSSAQSPVATSPLESVVYLVRRDAPGIRPVGSFDGLGLRGNESVPVDFDDVAVPREDWISVAGEGAKTILEVVLPWFSVGTAAMANGLCRAALDATTRHVRETRFVHTGSGLRDLPNLRARLTQMSVRTEQARALLGVTLGEIENPSEATPLFVLQSRLASLEAAIDVTDLAMKACGGAAFSKSLGIERTFRDARAGWVMAPTVDHLNDFVGRALTGLPLFG